MTTAPATKRIPYTPTNLDKFKTCPRQYKASYINHDMPYFQSPQAERGDKIHKALEAYLLAKGDYELPEYAIGAKATLDYLLETYEVAPEVALGVTTEFEPCGWKDPNVWFRGKADVVLRRKDNPEHVGVLDWKTGKPQSESDVKKYGNKFEVQSELLAIVAAKTYNASAVTTLFVMIDHGVVKANTYFFTDNQAIVQAHAPLFSLMGKIEKATQTNVFPPRPNGLCASYCGLTKCQHNGNFEGGVDYEG